MSTISGIGASAWSSTSSTRPMRPPGGMDPSKMKEELFAKVDADSSGTVDKTELQGMLDATVNKSGGTTVSAEDLYSTLDTDSDGSLNADELDAGMKSLMPPPPDTMAFAQSRSSSEAPQGPPPPDGPPPGGPPPEASSASSSSTSSTEATDPLDTNSDGTVSAQEKAAGELAEAMSKLFDAVDSDDDNTVSATERDTFLQMLNAAADQATQATSAASSDGSSSTSQDPSKRGFDLAEFANMVLQQYAQASAGSAAQSVGSTLSVAA